MTLAGGLFFAAGIITAVSIHAIIEAVRDLRAEPDLTGDDLRPMALLREGAFPHHGTEPSL